MRPISVVRDKLRDAAEPSGGNKNYHFARGVRGEMVHHAYMEWDRWLGVRNIWDLYGSSV